VLNTGKLKADAKARDKERRQAMKQKMKVGGQKMKVGGFYSKWL